MANSGNNALCAIGRELYRQVAIKPAIVLLGEIDADGLLLAKQKLLHQYLTGKDAADVNTHAVMFHLLNPDGSGGIIYLNINMFSVTSNESRDPDMPPIFGERDKRLTLSTAPSLFYINEIVYVRTHCTIEHKEASLLSKIVSLKTKKQWFISLAG